MLMRHTAGANNPAVCGWSAPPQVHQGTSRGPSKAVRKDIYREMCKSIYHNRRFKDKCKGATEIEDRQEGQGEDKGQGEHKRQEQNKGNIEGKGETKSKTVKSAKGKS